MYKAIMDQFEQRQMIQKVRENYFKIEVEVLQDGTLPTKKNKSDAGFDLYATSDIVIYPGQVIKHPLNIRLKLPKNTWAEITSKSGLGSQGLLVYAGVIDEEYRGIPHAVMSNIYLIEKLDPDGLPLMRTTPIVIKKGEKVAQLIMSPYNSEFYVEQVDQVDTDTVRAEGGFGSTGRF
jgi:dUTP pyrophosphatase